MKKKKILLLADDMRLHSGVGTMSKSFIERTVHKYDWVQLGGAVNHPEEGKISDISEELAKETGVKDASCRIYPISGYGNQQVLREIIARENPDAILHFTDPRFWGWLYEMEHEIRQNIPIMYYNIWDDLPYPHWNENAYESCDLIMSISKQTYNINKQVCQRKPRTDWDLKYVQHGIDENTFFPVEDTDTEYISFRENMFKQLGHTPSFVLGFNSRNIRRKGIQDLISAYTNFMDDLSEEERKDCVLLLHTDPVDNNGTDLPAHINMLCPHPVVFSDKKIPPKYMNYVYNAMSVCCNPSSAEGFGLSHMEAMMSGVPTISTVVGGLQDQQGWRKKNGKPVTLEDFTVDIPSNSTGKMGISHGPWTYPLFPQINMGGSTTTPYIYDSRPNVEDMTQALKFWYRQGEEERKRCGSIGRDWAIENNFTAKGMGEAMLNSIEGCFKNWKIRDRFIMIDANIEPPKYPTGALV